MIQSFERIINRKKYKSVMARDGKMLYNEIFKQFAEIEAKANLSKNWSISQPPPQRKWPFSCSKKTIFLHGYHLYPDK